MTQQRYCNLDDAVIDEANERFYTVTDSQTGLSKDICYGCARSLGAVHPWTPTTAYPVGARVSSTAGSGRFVYDCIQAGTSGAVEPSWPTNKSGRTVDDGSVVWQSNKAPTDNSSMKIRKSDVTADDSLYGWMVREDA